MLIDSHAHFDMLMESTGESEEDIMLGYDEAGIIHAVQVSVEPDGFSWSRDFARRNRERGIVFSLGIHPSSQAEESHLNNLKEFTRETMNSADGELLFAIGECGLDYYRMKQPVEIQRRSFEFQLDLAVHNKLPVIIHSRDSMQDTLQILRDKKISYGIMHCFPGNAHDAKQFLDLGFYISFAGNTTYKAATIIQDAAEYVPMDRILVETDCPFLTPVPLRGQTNRCQYVKHTVDFIATLRKIKAESLQEAVIKNFEGLCKRK